MFLTPCSTHSPLKTRYKDSGNLELCFSILLSARDQWFLACTLYSGFSLQCMQTKLSTLQWNEYGLKNVWCHYSIGPFCWVFRIVKNLKWINTPSFCYPSPSFYILAEAALALHLNYCAWLWAVQKKGGRVEILLLHLSDKQNWFRVMHS